MKTLWDPYGDFKKQVLPNGLTVHTAFWDRPWLAVDFIVHVGGREDSAGKDGLAHVLEHCLSENIPGRTYEQARRFFEQHGGGADFGSINYFSTHLDCFIPYDVKVVQEAFDIFGGLLFNESITQHIEREQKIILREWNERFRYPDQVEWALAPRRALFPGHRLERYSGAMGVPSGFMQVTAADIQDFYDRYYVPANVEMIVVGGADSKKLVDLVAASSLGVMKPGTRNAFPEAAHDLTHPASQRFEVVLSDLFKKEIKQARIEATWALPGNLKEGLLRIVKTTLHDVLYEEFREKRGATYGMGVSSSYFQDVLEFSVSGEIAPEDAASVEEALPQIIASAMEREDTIEHNRRMLMTQVSMLDVSGNGLARGAANDIGAYHRIVKEEEILEELMQTSLDEIRDVFKLLSSKRQFTFVVKP